ncbi:phosphatidylserine decarboxylase [Bacillus sp. FSL W7-1360]
MKKQLFRACIELHNHKVASALLKKFSQSRMSKGLIPWYCRTYQVDVSEAKAPIDDFDSLHHFFIRELKKGARPIALGENEMVAPVDGVCVEAGEMTPEMCFQVKGKQYAAEELLGGKDVASQYEKGQYVVLYLSPSHYHRIHSPVDATCVCERVLGGRSYPVNELGLKYGKQALSKNYRQVLELLLPSQKKMALVNVGATNVNSIIRTNKSDIWKKGEEVAYFSFGSTVVLIYEHGTVDIKVKNGDEVRMGEVIGELL